MTSTPFSAGLGPLSATPMDASAKVDDSAMMSSVLSSQELNYMDMFPLGSLPRDVFPPLLEQSNLLDPSVSHCEGPRSGEPPRLGSLRLSHDISQGPDAGMPMSDHMDFGQFGFGSRMSYPIPPMTWGL